MIKVIKHEFAVLVACLFICPIKVELYKFNKAIIVNLNDNPIR